MPQTNSALCVADLPALRQPAPSPVFLAPRSRSCARPSQTPTAPPSDRPAGARSNDVPLAARSMSVHSTPLRFRHLAPVAAFWRGCLAFSLPLARPRLALGHLDIGETALSAALIAGKLNSCIGKHARPFACGNHRAQRRCAPASQRHFLPFRRDRLSFLLNALSFNLSTHSSIRQVY